jgi:hypothetical protein
MRGSDVSRDLPAAEELYGGDDDWLARGNTAICGPEGDVLAGPLEGREGIVYAELDVGHARKVRRQFDPVGHYSRPDVFRLYVDTTPPVVPWSKHVGPSGSQNEPAWPPSTSAWSRSNARQPWPDVAESRG